MGSYGARQCPQYAGALMLTDRPWSRPPRHIGDNISHVDLNLERKVRVAAGRVLAL